MPPWIWFALLQVGIVAFYCFYIFPCDHSKSKSAKASGIDAIRDSLQKSELASIKSFLAANLDKEKLTEETFSYFKDKIFQAINYAISRHDWYEDQRSKVLQTALTIASAFLAIAGASVRISALPSVDLVTVSIGTAFVALIGIITITILYRAELGTNRPYRTISDIKFWYFRYNLPGRSNAHEAELELEQAKAVAGDRDRFFKRIISGLELSDSIREDIEQLFILHVLQRYKSESLTKMQQVLSGITAFLGAEVILWLLVSTR